MSFSFSSLFPGIYMCAINWFISKSSQAFHKNYMFEVHTIQCKSLHPLWVLNGGKRKMLDNNQKQGKINRKIVWKGFFHDTPSLQTLFAESSVKQLAEVQYLCSENSPKKKIGKQSGRVGTDVRKNVEREFYNWEFKSCSEETRESSGSQRVSKQCSAEFTQSYHYPSHLPCLFVLFI